MNRLIICKFVFLSEVIFIFYIEYIVLTDSWCGGLDKIYG